MGIFSKLIPGASKKAAGSEQRVRALLDGLDDSSPIRRLKDIEDRLTEIARIERDFGAEAAQSAFIQLDQAGNAARTAVLQRYLSSLDQQSSGQTEWSALDSHAAELIAAQTAISAVLLPLVQSETERNRAARDAVAMLRSWALRKKLQHFRYQVPAAALWQQANGLLSQLIDHKLEQILVVPYPGESAVTPLREYLIGAYFECLPEGKLLPQQQEAIDRFLRGGDRPAFTPQPEANSTHCIDLSTASGPVAMKDGTAAGPTFRFLSTIRPHEQLRTLADALASGQDAPKWLSSLALNPSLQENSLRTVANHWSSRPPRRMAARREDSLELRAVIGFNSAYQMVNAAQEMRSDLAAKNSLELLRQIESTGRNTRSLSLESESRQITLETWQRGDLSVSGFSAIPPALLPRHSVGTLVATRPADGVDWRLGLIRRIGRDAAKRPTIGIETIDDDPFCAHANLIDAEQIWADGVDAAGWSNVIFLKNSGHDVLLPPGSFASGRLVNATQGTQTWKIRLETLLDRGPDYDRARFSNVA